MRVLLALLLAATSVNTLGAQVAPSTKGPGRRPQYVVFYFGSSTCVPCRDPEFKVALQQMRPLLKVEAERAGHDLSVVGVAIDAQTDSGLALLQPIEIYDAVVVGDDWTNLVAERFIWGDPNAIPGIPQIILVERVITPGPRGSSVPRVIRRIPGQRPIIDWIRGGAKFPESPPAGS